MEQKLPRRTIALLITVFFALLGASCAGSQAGDENVSAIPTLVATATETSTVSAAPTAKPTATIVPATATSSADNGSAVKPTATAVSATAISTVPATVPASIPTSTAVPVPPTATVPTPVATGVPATPTPTQTLPPTATPSPVFDSRYTQQILMNGTNIIAGAAAAPEALSRAGEIMSAMLAGRPDITTALIDRAHYVIVVEENVCVLDLPEYVIWKGLFTCDRIRGFGGTLTLPISSGGEENLLCLPSDPFHDQSVFVHEFGHTVMNVGLPFTEDGSTILIELRAAYSLAVSTGLWANTYALTNWEEYWAVGTAAWFDAQYTVNSPFGDGVYNNVGTREALIAYDPVLAELLGRVYSVDWRYSCPSAS